MKNIWNRAILITIAASLDMGFHDDLKKFTAIHSNSCSASSIVVHGLVIPSPAFLFSEKQHCYNACNQKRPDRRLSLLKSNGNTNNDDTSDHWMTTTTTNPKPTTTTESNTVQRRRLSFLKIPPPDFELSSDEKFLQDEDSFSSLSSTFPITTTTSNNAPSVHHNLSSSSAEINNNNKDWWNNEMEFVPTRSLVTRSDAGTLVMEITPQGITSGTVFHGVFSVAWFSAVVPATVAAVAGGGIFTTALMLPFWAAGGLIAKSSMVDPFVSTKLSIGQYAWSLERQYYGSSSSRRRRRLSPRRRFGRLLSRRRSQTNEGATEHLLGARVEIGQVVDDTTVHQYELRLYTRNINDRTVGVVSGIGRGLPQPELQQMANEINTYLQTLSSSDDSSDTAESE